MSALADTPQFEIIESASLPDDPADAINRRHVEALLAASVTPQETEHAHLDVVDEAVVLREPVVRQHAELGAVLAQRGHEFAELGDT